MLWYNLATLEGDRVYDQSGYGRHGTIYGAAWRRGPIGGMLNFDGVDDYVRIPHTLYLTEGNAPFSLEMLFRLEEVASVRGEYHMMFQQMDGVGIGRTWVAQDITTDQVYTYLGGTPLRGSVLERGKWYHIVVLYDGSALSIYLNNTLDAGPDTRAVDEGEIGDSLIGVDKVFGNYLQGDVALVRLYNRALSIDGISAYYHYYLTQLKEG